MGVDSDYIRFITIRVPDITPYKNPGSLDLLGFRGSRFGEPGGIRTHDLLIRSQSGNIDFTGFVGILVGVVVGVDHNSAPLSASVSPS